MGLTVSIAALAAGLVLAFFGLGSSRTSLFIGLGVLISLPVVNVAAALVEELRRRDWPFAAAALAVLFILAYNLYQFM